MENNVPKFYGAGIASSFGEIENMVKCKNFIKLDLRKKMVSPNEILVQDLQKMYYYFNSIDDMIEQLNYFKITNRKPFETFYNFSNNTVETNIPIEFE